MGLRDRILDYVAKVFMPVPDHPARGGMTGEPTPDAGDEEGDDAGDEPTPDAGDEEGDDAGTMGDATEPETDGTR